MGSQAIGLAHIRLLIIAVGHAEIALQAAVMRITSGASP